MSSLTLELIESIRRVREEVKNEPDKLARLQRLQAWQLQRLSRTYADFLADERYREALEFFMRDLYGPHDFSQRDRDLQRVLGTWERVLPPRAIAAIRSALELEALTQSLDLAVLEQLGDREIDELTYADAYRRAGRARDRQRQIRLILDAGRALNELTVLPWVEKALRWARTPARLAGVQALHEFLERGFRAFVKMGKANEMLRAIEDRETRIMKRLFAGTPAPFDVQQNANRQAGFKPQRS